MADLSGQTQCNDRAITGAFAEFDGGLSRKVAEDLAARAQEFADADQYWQWLADYVVNH